MPTAADPRRFPVRVTDQPSIGLGGMGTHDAPFKRAATLDDVVYELRLLRRELASRTLSARLTHLWHWIVVRLPRWS